LAERNITVRGHYLMWAPIQPQRGRAGQPQNIFKVPVDQLAHNQDASQRSAIRQAAFAHLERTLAFAGSRVAEWDAINHIANDNHVSYATVFGTQIYADVIKRARELAPHAQIWVNEGNVLTAGERLQKYHDMIRELIALGGKPDGIGFMAHFREGELTSPPEIYRRLDRFAALVPNLQLTELDIDTADEQRQAEFMRDVLTIAFSHPAVAGIVMWQVWGQGAGQKALWRADWSVKPAGQAWLDKVYKEWWTETTGKSASDGTFKARGFHGDYLVTARVGDETRTLRTRVTGDASVADLVF
jgi:endo-1,4-beta-xylanase